jgi:hypothetical protein
MSTSQLHPSLLLLFLLDPLLLYLNLVEVVPRCCCCCCRSGYCCCCAAAPPVVAVPLAGAKARQAQHQVRQQMAHAAVNPNNNQPIVTTDANAQQTNSSPSTLRATEEPSQMYYRHLISLAANVAIYKKVGYTKLFRCVGGFLFLCKLALAPLPIRTDTKETACHTAILLN